MTRPITDIRKEFPAGSGFFETMRTKGNAIAELNRHMRRARKTANVLDMPFLTEEELRRYISLSFAEQVFEVGRLRIAFGDGMPQVHYAAYQESNAAARLTFAQETNIAEGEQLKTYPYDDRFSIVQTAHIQGFDDAIVFNKKNNVTETGFSNIALLIDGQWITPPIAAGILPGVMRSIAIERCHIAVRDIHISEMTEVRGALLLSSLRIAQPVSHIGDYELPEGAAMQTLASEIASKVEYFSVG